MKFKAAGLKKICLQTVHLDYHSIQPKFQKITSSVCSMCIYESVCMCILSSPCGDDTCMFTQIYKLCSLPHLFLCSFILWMYMVFIKPTVKLSVEICKHFFFLRKLKNKFYCTSSKVFNIRKLKQRHTTRIKIKCAYSLLVMLKKQI